MKFGAAIFVSGMVALAMSGCSHSHSAPMTVHAPPTAAATTVASLSAPVPILPSLSDLNATLSIVASPQISRDRSLLPPGRVQDLGGSWVRFGPARAARTRRIVQKDHRADMPFTARIVVAHAQAYSEPLPSRSRAAHAPLAHTQTWTTTYFYEYQMPPGASGTWVYKDEEDGAWTETGKG